LSEHGATLRLQPNQSPIDQTTVSPTQSVTDEGKMMSSYPTTTSLAEIGAIIADPGRASMLIALADGTARTARELADCAGITPQTASTHLAKLVGCGFVRMEKRGRHHYHRIASGEVAQLIETMHLAATALAPRGKRIRRAADDVSMRLARSCYDHLAGRVGVALTDALAARDYVRVDAPDVEVTEAGAKFLSDWGVDLAPARRSKRPFCRACIDWSERRPHLAGAVGSAILDHVLGLGWMRRRQDSRVLSITSAGHIGFSTVFGFRA